MKDFVDASAFNTEQGNRARKLFAAVVLAALDDAIADDRKYGKSACKICGLSDIDDQPQVLVQKVPNQNNAKFCRHNDDLPEV